MGISRSENQKARGEGVTQNRPSSNRNHRLIDGKITKYMLPSVMMTMAIQLGNIVDMMLVGNLLGTKAMTAIRLSMPVATVEQVVGYGLGTGAAIAAGTLLGRRDRKGASAVFSSVFLLTVIYGVLFTASAFFLSAPLARALAGGGELTDMVRQFLFVWMLGGPVIGIGLFLMNFMGVESRPGLSSTYIIVSNVINLVLDYVFLAHTTLGITGAALSTMIGYLGGMVVYIRYFVSKEKMLTLRPAMTPAAIGEALGAGTPTLIYMGMNFLETLGSNLIVSSILGDDGVAIFTVCANIMMIAIMVTGGMIGVIPNMAGVLYGEKDYYGLRAVCMRVLKVTIVATAGLMIVILLFTRQFAGLFGMKTDPLLSLSLPVLRCLIFSMPFFVWNKFLTSYYQCIRERRLAGIITILEYGAVHLPALYIALRLSVASGSSGFLAIGLSFVISEGLTVVISYVVSLKRHPKNPVFILPAENSGTCLDLTIVADEDEVPALVRSVYDFCVKNGVDTVLANRMTVAAEEMTENIIAYGGKTSKWIDLCLIIEEDVVRMRIRDNGIPFNPTVYEFDKDLFDINGIEIVKRLASDISYVRTIDLNNTVIEVRNSV